jgi:N-formylglutamate amidohydrolase
MPKPPFDLFLPERQDTAVLFASAHSGRDYPRAFLRQTVLDDMAIRSSEDAFVDLLFAGAPGHGAPLIAATVPRAYVDLNRAAEELDPAVVEGAARAVHNPRVASGLGVIPRVVANGRAIYRGKMAQAEAQDRLRHAWHPWHRALAALIEDTRARFGQAVLIDCHSMPHEAIESIAHGAVRKPEVVLGDRFGASAAPDVVDRVEAAFAAAGLKVVRNAPFAGAYTAQHYGRPTRGQHVVQVEIDRSIYMNEQMIRPNNNFDAFRLTLDGVIADLAAIGRPRRMPLAAE